MAGVSEHNRQRIALAMVLLSMCLILIGFGIIIAQNMTMEVPGPPASRPAHGTAARKTDALALRWILLWLPIFGLIFVVSTLAFLRWSRNFRRWIFRKPRPPTPSEDVWAMHKLPEEALRQWTEDAGPPEPQA